MTTQRRSPGRLDNWLKPNGWGLAAGLTLIGGIYAIVKGIDALS